MNSMLKVREVADWLRVSQAMIYILCAQGRLPHVRVGVAGRGTIRIRAEDLAAFVEANKTQPSASGTPRV